MFSETQTAAPPEACLRPGMNAEKIMRICTGQPRVNVNPYVLLAPNATSSYDVTKPGIGANVRKCRFVIKCRMLAMRKICHYIYFAMTGIDFPKIVINI